MCDIIAASEFNDMCDINQFLNMRNSYLLYNSLLLKKHV